jgi:hypothetical protein
MKLHPILCEQMVDRIPRFNPARSFPVWPTEGRDLQEETSHHRRSQRKHSPGDCIHFCEHFTTCIRQFGASRPGMHGRRRRPFSEPYMTGSSFNEKRTQSKSYIKILKYLSQETSYGPEENTSIPGMGRDSSLRCSDQTGSEAHQVYLKTLCAGIKRPEREADHSPVSSAKIKNDCICISTPIYIFIEWGV